MKKNTIIALVILFLAGAGIFYFLIMGNIGAKYATVEVEKGKVEKFVEEIGVISSRNLRNYYGKNFKKVEKIDLQLGDSVKKGQLLIQFEDDVDLEIQKVQRQIDALKATYNEALAGTDFEKINSAKIEIKNIESSIDLENYNKNVVEELYENGAIAEKELKQVKHNLEQLENDLLLAQSNYNQLVKGLSGNMKKKYEAEIGVLLLSLESLEKSKGDSSIYADFDGIVTELNTFQGDTPSGALKILEVMDPLEKIIVVDFMMEDAISIRKDMKAEVDDEKLAIKIDNIKVEKIHPKSFTVYSQLGVEENRQRVEIDLPPSNEALSFGLKLETKVMVEESRDALFVDKDVVYEKDFKKYVDLLEDEKPVEREVKTGIENEDLIEIKEGLKEGEKVILHYKKN